VVCDIFEEHEGRLGFSDDAGDRRPKVARVFSAELLPGDAERLARVSGNDAMNSAAPRQAVEGSHVRPKRGVVHEALFDTRRQLRAEIDFPLHVADRSSASNSQTEAEVEAAVAGAEGEHVEGRCSHICLRELRRLDLGLFLEV
jgi:hypothetical protein